MTVLEENGGLLDSIKRELKATESSIQTLVAKQTDEIKKHGETAADTARRLAEQETKYNGIVDEIKGKQVELETKLNRLGLEVPAHETKTAGQKVIESEEFKNFVAGSSRKARVEVKALTTNAASAGVLIPRQRLTEIIRPEDRVHVRSLLPTGQTTSNAIEFPRETLFTNAAAPVAEGALKPESNLTFDLATANVRTIAHILTASKQMLDDAPALQGYIDNRMVEGLYIVEDRQLLYGDGTGQNLLGLIPQATRYNRGYPAGFTAIDTLRRASTQTRLAEYTADGIILNPVDWETIELAKGSDGRYLWTNVNDGGIARLWRMPVVDTTAIAAGEFLVGAFGMAAQVFMRQDATVEISESDVDNFRRNMITIRVEERLALAVFRPQSFIHGTFAAPATTP